jgi:ABC-type multidrug transport system ATPase subunit/pSer/pThr/pTyr-binding forkhead associated (FHA) protein/ABC-type multidrug transport system permease subunit
MASCSRRDEVPDGDDRARVGRAPAAAERAAGGQASLATLLHDGRRIPIAGDGVTVGRLADNEVVIPRQSVSRHHARITPVQGGYWITDLDSRNGTQLNGERFRGESRWLWNGDTVVIGGDALRFVTGQETRYGAEPAAVLRTELIAFPAGRLTIGRDPSNDVALDDPNVSRFHAEVVRAGDAVELRDLGSRNGTRVDGSPVRRATLSPGSEIGIGPYRLLFDGHAFVARAERGALRLDAEGVAMRVKGKQILAPTSVTIEPGQLVAIVGESGSGKSTLIKALAGVTTPSAGTITVSGEPVAARLTDIGYLPQDEIVHGKLSVREALTYAARLRLPQDTSAAEIAGSVAGVLDELALVEQAETRIESLSGGQRKRVGLAAELLGRPSLLFLDEPTTGLDPGLETRMMALLRELAARSRAVVVVTHATKSLQMCAKLIVMGRGGELCFQGSPDEALRFFGAETYDDIYVALDNQPATEWRRRFLDEQRQQPVALEPEAQAPRARGRQARRRHASLLRQAVVLTRRYAQLFVRDRRNMLILIGQVPVLALAIVGLFKVDAFAAKTQVSEAVKLLFLVVTLAIWLGSIDSAREIIKEKNVFVREAAVGVRTGAYLLSKAVVLFVLAAVQTVLLAAIIFAFQPLHHPPGTYAVVLALLLLTAFGAVGMGLLMSAAVRTQDQATSFIPLILIPQLFFGGSIVPIATMSAPLAALSKVVVAQWSYAGVGSVLGLNARIAANHAYARISGFGTTYFDAARLSVILILVAFVVASFAGVAALLRRQDAA